jgi:pimeloyl-ACP methyl ester carboxylesterase
VIAVDHIGVGDSSVPDLDSITFGHLAAANDGAVREALRLLAAGRLATGLPEISPGLVVGMGQSMGGCIGIIQQARHRSFDALAVLGYSGARMHLPEPPPGYDMLRYAFHWDEEPDSLVEADLGGGPQPWRSPTMPSCVPTMAGSGLIVAEAGAVDVPLFLAVGERDVIEDLNTEPDAFRSSDDITLFRLRRAAHMHNFAPTRMVLWRRLEAWITALEASGLPAVAATRL